VIKEVINIIKENMNIKYEQCTYDEKWKIIQQEFGEDNECEIFGRIECIRVDISYIIRNSVKDSLSLEEMKEGIILLQKNSIFNDECILLWIEQYSKEYHNYFAYILSLENYRVIGLNYLTSLVGRYESIISCNTALMDSQQK